MSVNSNSLAGAGGRQLRQKLATRSRRLWRAYWDRRARRATVLLLEALDDRALKDIGLSRSQIGPIVLGMDTARPRP